MTVAAAATHSTLTIGAGSTMQPTTWQNTTGSEHTRTRAQATLTTRDPTGDKSREAPGATSRTQHSAGWHTRTATRRPSSRPRGGSPSTANWTGASAARSRQTRWAQSRTTRCFRGTARKSLKVSRAIFGRNRILCCVLDKLYFLANR